MVLLFTCSVYFAALPVFIAASSPKTVDFLSEHIPETESDNNKDKTPDDLKKGFASVSTMCCSTSSGDLCPDHDLDALTLHEEAPDEVGDDAPRSPSRFSGMGVGGLVLWLCSPLEDVCNVVRPRTYMDVLARRCCEVVRVTPESCLEDQCEGEGEGEAGGASGSSVVAASRKFLGRSGESIVGSTSVFPMAMSMSIEEIHQQASQRRTEVLADLERSRAHRLGVDVGVLKRVLASSRVQASLERVRACKSDDLGRVSEVGEAEKMLAWYREVEDQILLRELKVVEGFWAWCRRGWGGRAGGSVGGA